MTLSASEKVGPYEILARIGAGGMGEVWRARDTRLGRDVAIKILTRTGSSDADRIRRFEVEMKAVGRLNHPNVLAVHDVGSHDGVPYLVSELLEGRRSAIGSTRARCRRRPSRAPPARSRRGSLRRMPPASSTAT